MWAQWLNIIALRYLSCHQCVTSLSTAACPACPVLPRWQLRRSVRWEWCLLASCLACIDHYCDTPTQCTPIRSMAKEPVQVTAAHLGTSLFQLICQTARVVNSSVPLVPVLCDKRDELVSCRTLELECCRIDSFLGRLASSTVGPYVSSRVFGLRPRPALQFEGKHSLLPSAAVVQRWLGRGHEGQHKGPNPVGCPNGAI